jgi:TolB protein
LSRALCILVVGLVALGGATGAALATAPGRNGQIVYAHFPTLWVLNADGSGARKLPWVKRSEADNPDWSPDGKRIAFDRCAVKCEIWTIDSDGTNQKRLGPDCLRKAGVCQDRTTPAWSPDGRRIAFGGNIGAVRPTGVEHAELFVMNANGTGPRRLTHVSDGKKPFSIDVRAPSWSPDGKQIVFEVENFKTADPPDRRALYVVNADGSGLRQLTQWSLNGGDSPDWSPDGKLILFRTVSISNKHHGNLHTIHPDGTGLTKLTDFPAPKTVLTGSFSPDGEWITFSRFTDSPYPAIYVMRANGTDQRRVSLDGAAYEPDWGPVRR